MRSCILTHGRPFWSCSGLSTLPSGLETHCKVKHSTRKWSSIHGLGCSGSSLSGNWIGPVRFAGKTSRNTVLADLSWEKNIVPVKKISWKVRIIRQTNKALVLWTPFGVTVCLIWVIYFSRLSDAWWVFLKLCGSIKRLWINSIYSTDRVCLKTEIEDACEEQTT